MCGILCYNSDMGDIRHQVLAIWKDKAVVKGTLKKKDPVCPNCPTNTKKKAGKSRKIFQPDDGPRRQVNRIRRRNQTPGHTDQ